MRKSTLFISTTLTIFMLAVMFGVVSAYQQNVKNNEAAASPTAESVTQQAAVTAQPVSTLPAVVSPEQATTIAAQFMGDTNVYSVEVVDYKGVPAFLVTFSSGKLVYIGSTGEILALSQVQPVVVSAPVQKKNKNNNASPSQSSGGGGEHDSHDD
jgi:uncharacterized protein YpmB